MRSSDALVSANKIKTEESPLKEKEETKGSVPGREEDAKKNRDKKKKKDKKHKKHKKSKKNKSSKRKVRQLQTDIWKKTVCSSSTPLNEETAHSLKKGVTPMTGRTNLHH